MLSRLSTRDIPAVKRRGRRMICAVGMAEEPDRAAAEMPSSALEEGRFLLVWLRERGSK